MDFRDLHVYRKAFSLAMEVYDYESGKNSVAAGFCKLITNSIWKK